MRIIHYNLGTHVIFRIVCVCTVRQFWPSTIWLLLIWCFGSRSIWELSKSHAMELDIQCVLYISIQLPWWFIKIATESKSALVAVFRLISNNSYNIYEKTAFSAYQCSLTNMFWGIFFFILFFSFSFFYQSGQCIDLLESLKMFKINFNNKNRIVRSRCFSRCFTKRACVCVLFFCQLVARRRK